MSMCGELENLEHEINQTKIKLELLQPRKDDLVNIIKKSRSEMSDVHLDPAKRSWYYDDVGHKRDKKSGKIVDIEF